MRTFAIRGGDQRLAELAAAGDERAFEVIYDRHHAALLAFCRHMVGSREEAEDALQQTFLRAHRALLEHGAPDDLRPWLFTIARNRCCTLLDARHAEPEVDGTRLASTDGLGEQVQARADLQAVVADVERLPDDQRAALVLAELADFSHAQIGEVIGVRTHKVKALIHQARTTLIAERDAREQPCDEVREELATARAGALRRGPLRRHLRQCEPCRAYRDAVAEQRRALALVLPVAPSLGLKSAVLGAASAGGGAAAGGVSLGSGLAAKVVTSALVVGTAAGGGAAIVREVETAPAPAPARKVLVHQAPAAAHVPTRAAPRAVARTPAAAAPRRHVERRVAGSRGRVKARREHAAAPSRPPGQSRRALAHARAPGQQGKAPKLPGSSRSARAPAKKPHPPKPVKPVKPAKPVKAAGPPLVPPGQQKKAAAAPKTKTR